MIQMTGKMKIASLLFLGMSICQTGFADTSPAVNRVLPLSPHQVELLREKFQSIDQAGNAPPIDSHQLGATVRNINLTDSAPPPLLHVVTGYTTSISFIGANGKPWPITSGVAGGAAISIIQPSKDDPYNSSIVVKQSWVSSNVTFYLQGRVRPVILYLTTAADTTHGLDGNVTVKLDGLPPGTAPDPIKNVTGVSDALLNSLNHAPGSNWESVVLDDADIPVGIHYWISPDHSKAIVRLSAGTLVMPEWGSQASSPDNTVTSYQFNHAPLMLWVDSDDGQSFQVRVQDATRLIAGGNFQGETP